MKDLARILVGPLVWLASFSAVYGLHGLICGHDLGGSAGGLDLARLLMISAYGLAVLVQVAIVRALHQSRLAAARGSFVGFTSRATAWVGLVAAIWTLLPAATTTYCL